MTLDRKEIAQRLRDARQAVGYSQAEVARLLEMHRPTISEIEAGRRAVSAEELYRFAELYATPVSELLTDPNSSVDRALEVLYRREGPERPQTQVAIRRFVERCRAERELEDLLQLTPRGDARPAYRTDHPRTKWDAVRQGEAIAEHERRRLDIGAEPVRGISELLERQGVRIGPVLALEGDELDGFYLETEALGACIAVNPDRDDWTGFRANFTAAHEYAHWLLRDRQVELFAFQGGTDDLLEVRANAFAAAFLMPRAGLIAYFDRLGLTTGDRLTHLSPGDVVRAMDHFCVSRTALLFRLLNVGLASDEMVRQLRDFRLRPITRALQISFATRRFMGTRLPTLAIHAWRRGLIGASRAAGLCEIDLEDFRKLVRTIGEEPDESVDVPIIGAASVG